MHSSPPELTFAILGYTIISNDQNERGEFVVLLVDDEPIVRDFVQYALSRYGFSVLAARDGVEALELSRRYIGHIHLLLTDVKMPQMTGPELVKEIAGERPQMRILLMSGESAGEIPEHLRFEMLRKPFLPRTLVDRIRAALDDASPCES